MYTNEPREKAGRDVERYERDLQNAKEGGDKAGERKSYYDLGCVHLRLGALKRAIDYLERHLKIAKEVGDKAGVSYSNFGSTYGSLEDLKKAIECHERHMQFAKEVREKAGEGSSSSGNLDVGDCKRAVEYNERAVKIAKEVEDKAAVAISLYCIGVSLANVGLIPRALDCFQSSVMLFNEIVADLQSKDEWNTSFLDLQRLYLKQGEVLETLLAAKEGSTQALKDLMELKHGSGNARYQSRSPEKSAYNPLSCLSSETVFIEIAEGEILLWVIQNGKDVKLRRKKMNNYFPKNKFISKEEVTVLIDDIFIKAGIKSDNKSPQNWNGDDEMAKTKQIDVLRTFYDIIVAPIADLIIGNELIFVPEGPLCLVPYAALMDSRSKYLCESFRIRVVPSLTTLKLIADCPADFHNKTGALLVGDPCYEEVNYKNNKPIPLPHARKEVEMIGQILGTAPLTGEKASKDEVLRRLSSVALVHIAAHGRMETGEIFLAPNPIRETREPKEEDYLLKLTDVSKAQLRARLVVLSCCYTARGDIKAEGVVGIARAFLSAGARSVLVSLWRIDDKATQEFMKHFYEVLVRGKRASEALKGAMECMRISKQFSEVKYWAPFVLIGDDVTLELTQSL